MDHGSDLAAMAHALPLASEETRSALAASGAAVSLSVLRLSNNLEERRARLDLGTEFMTMALPTALGLSLLVLISGALCLAILRPRFRMSTFVVAAFTAAMATAFSLLPMIAIVEVLSFLGDMPR